MRCPYCHESGTRVVDTRLAEPRSREDGESIRRRRECVRCGSRFTTYEDAEEIPISVVKKGGGLEPFRKDKLLRGLLRACTKREVSLSRLEEMVGEIESGLRSEGRYKVASGTIGEMVLERLQDVDLVAYVRFASVYREFESIEEFKQELENLTKERVP